MTALDDLLVAARAWRSGLIGGTGTAVWPAVTGLLAAIEVFDPVPCEHPRHWRVYRGAGSLQRIDCGYCGARDLDVVERTPMDGSKLNTAADKLDELADDVDEFTNTASEKAGEVANKIREIASQVRQWATEVGDEGTTAPA